MGLFAKRKEKKFIKQMLADMDVLHKKAVENAKAGGPIRWATGKNEIAEFSFNNPDTRRTGRCCYCGAALFDADTKKLTENMYHSKKYGAAKCGACNNIVASVVWLPMKKL